ncbi:MAG: transporter substrate-binding domain-containing protein [Lachnospiraceae bacterium]|nr:transporter substrate-binding domain-containing protein [Lachnospiraceae bacterium]
MKRLLSVLLVVTMAASMLTGCGNKSDQSRLDKIKEAGKIQVATEPYFAPYEFIDNTKQGDLQYQGADMQLARYIAEEMGVELEIVPLEFSAVLTGISDGKYDLAISGLGYTAERAESMELSEAYFTEDVDIHGLLVKEENVSKYKALSDFDGLKIAYQSGSLQDTYANSQLKDITPMPFDDVAKAVLAVQEGKADAAAVSYDNGALFCQSNEGIGMCEPLFSSDGAGVVIAAPKGETELIEEINKIVAKSKETEMYATWWDEAKKLAAGLGLE